MVGKGRRQELGVPREVCHTVSPAEAVPAAWMHRQTLHSTDKPFTEGKSVHVPLAVH